MRKKSAQEIVKKTLMLIIVSSLISVQLGSSQTKGAMAVRELYAPAHFGNSYEVMGELEMRDVLNEAVYWGYNRYGDWFDMDNCTDPFSDVQHYKLGHALWDKKTTNFRTAQSLGLDCDFIITPNHVYLDQCTPELLAEKKGRIFGELICPSIPTAHDIILQNYKNIFQDLQQSGVHLKSISFCPYDYGGCACKACDPWILTFAKLSHEISFIAAQYHPGIETHMIGWWWKAEEHEMFAKWVDEFAPGWVKSIYMHIPYRETDVSQAILPQKCERRAFVHIGYAQVSKNDPIDKYGHLGPVIAAARLEKTVENLFVHNVTGYMAYSEGVYEDVNRAILAGLSSGQYLNSDKVIGNYVRRYFDAGNSGVQDWIHWLKKWDAPFDVEPGKALQDFTELNVKKSDNWRMRQWQLKIELFQLHRQIGNGSEWTTERLAVVDQFWAVQEELFRTVWGLGPLRQILARKSTPLPWFKGWAQFISKNREIRTPANTEKM
jgi:hypothetical protein